MLTNKELATGLEVPASRVTEWLKRGMPRTSVETAAAWRMIHARPRGKNAVTIAKAALEKAPTAPDNANAKVEGDDWQSRLNRARRTEIDIHATLSASLSKGDLNSLSRLQTAHIAAIKEIAAAEIIALENEKALGNLIHRDNAKQLLHDVLTPLRQCIDLLPAQLASRCNPTQPQIARRALQEWLERTLVRVSTAESTFGK